MGLPLALSLADAGHDVLIVDQDEAAVARVLRGEMGFLEDGGDELLAKHVGGRLQATTDASRLSEAGTVVCIVGTPIDEYLNPQLGQLLALMDELKPHLRAGQLFILRSTVFPGATQRISRWVEEHVPGLELSFCPERVAQGKAIREIQSLPQIVSGITPEALGRARELFSSLGADIIELDPTEAELAKLFCNAWRYISFATANQFYSLCVQNGIDFYRVYDAITQDYPRMESLPGAGFAAGPCLFKDTMQLSAFFNNQFSLGQSAMMINEGLPMTLVESLRAHDLAGKTVGILGMTFKADCDDHRDSLAFKLRKLLLLECREVVCTDEYLEFDWLLPMEEVLEKADLLVVATPHARYRGLEPKQVVLDPWNHLGRGGLAR